jgi:integrase
MKVSQFLQHASINTTRAYIKRSDADMEAAINEIVDLA